MFSFGRAPERFLPLRRPEEDWFMKAMSPGELVSLLCGPYASILNAWCELSSPVQQVSEGEPGTL